MKYLRMISLVTVLLFAWTNICLSAPQVYSLKVDKDLAKVTQRYKGKSDKTIIHIQDAHSSYEAQENLARTICDLIPQINKNDNQKPFVGIEGAVGDYDLGSLRQFPDKRSRELVASDLVRDGKLIGAEMANIISDNDFSLFGCEDFDLFKKDFDLFYQSTVNKSDLEDALAALEAGLNDLKQAAFSAEQLDFDNRFSEFEENNGQFLMFIDDLNHVMNDHGVDIFNYSSLLQFHELSLLSKRLDHTELLSEVRSTTATFGMDTPEINDQQTIRKVVCHVAKELANQGSLSQYEQINLHLQYWNKEGCLDINSILQDMQKAAFDCLQAMSSSESQLAIVNVDKKWLSLKRMLRLKAFKADIKKYQSKKYEFSIQSIITELKLLSENDFAVNSDVLSKQLERAEAFYEYADKRDSAMLDNVMKRMNATGQDTGVLVTGGYHSEGLAERMRSEGLSYISICPNISNVAEDAAYMQRMTGQIVPISPMLASAFQASQINAVYKLVGGDTAFDALIKEAEAIMPVRGLTEKARIDSIISVLKQSDNSEYRNLADAIDQVLKKEGLAEKVQARLNDGENVDWNELLDISGELENQLMLKKFLMEFEGELINGIRYSEETHENVTIMDEDDDNEMTGMISIDPESPFYSRKPIREIGDTSLVLDGSVTKNQLEGYGIKTEVRSISVRTIEGKKITVEVYMEPEMDMALVNAVVSLSILSNDPFLDRSLLAEELVVISLDKSSNMIVIDSDNGVIGVNKAYFSSSKAEYSNRFANFLKMNNGSTIGRQQISGNNDVVQKEDENGEKGFFAIIGNIILFLLVIGTIFITLIVPRLSNYIQARKDKLNYTYEYVEAGDLASKSVSKRLANVFDFEEYLDLMKQYKPRSVPDRDGDGVDEIVIAEMVGHLKEYLFFARYSGLKKGKFVDSGTVYHVPNGGYNAFSTEVKSPAPFKLGSLNSRRYGGPESYEFKTKLGIPNLYISKTSLTDDSLKDEYLHIPTAIKNLLDEVSAAPAPEKIKRVIRILNQYFGYSKSQKVKLHSGTWMQMLDQILINEKAFYADCDVLAMYSYIFLNYLSIDTAAAIGFLNQDGDTMITSDEGHAWLYVSIEKEGYLFDPTRYVEVVNRGTDAASMFVDDPEQHEGVVRLGRSGQEIMVDELLHSYENKKKVNQVIAQKVFTYKITYGLTLWDIGAEIGNVIGVDDSKSIFEIISQVQHFTNYYRDQGYNVSYIKDVNKVIAGMIIGIPSDLTIGGKKITLSDQDWRIICKKVNLLAKNRNSQHRLNSRNFLPYLGSGIIQIFLSPFTFFGSFLLVPLHEFAHAFTAFVLGVPFEVVGYFGDNGKVAVDPTGVPNWKMFLISISGPLAVFGAGAGLFSAGCVSPLLSAGLAVSISLKVGLLSLSIFTISHAVFDLLHDDEENNSDGDYALKYFRKMMKQFAPFSSNSFSDMFSGEGYFDPDKTAAKINEDGRLHTSEKVVGLSSKNRRKSHKKKSDWIFKALGKIVVGLMIVVSSFIVAKAFLQTDHLSKRHNAPIDKRIGVIIQAGQKRIFKAETRQQAWDDVLAYIGSLVISTNEAGGIIYENDEGDFIVEFQEIGSEHNVGIDASLYKGTFKFFHTHPKYGNDYNPVYQACPSWQDIMSFVSVDSAESSIIAFGEGDISVMSKPDKYSASQKKITDAFKTYNEHVRKGHKNNMRKIMGKVFDHNLSGYMEMFDLGEGLSLRNMQINSWGFILKHIFGFDVDERFINTYDEYEDEVKSVIDKMAEDIEAEVYADMYGYQVGSVMLLFPFIGTALLLLPLLSNLFSPTVAFLAFASFSLLIVSVLNEKESVSNNIVSAGKSGESSGLAKVAALPTVAVTGSGNKKAKKEYGDLPAGIQESLRNFNVNYRTENIEEHFGMVDVQDMLFKVNYDEAEIGIVKGMLIVDAEGAVSVADAYKDTYMQIIMQNRQEMIDRFESERLSTVLVNIPAEVVSKTLNAVSINRGLRAKEVISGIRQGVLELKDDELFVRGELPSLFLFQLERARERLIKDLMFTDGDILSDRKGGFIPNKEEVKSGLLRGLLDAGIKEDDLASDTVFYNDSYNARLKALQSFADVARRGDMFYVQWNQSDIKSEDLLDFQSVLQGIASGLLKYDRKSYPLVQPFSGSLSRQEFERELSELSLTSFVTNLISEIDLKDEKEINVKVVDTAKLNIAEKEEFFNNLRDQYEKDNPEVKDVYFEGVKDDQECFAVLNEVGKVIGFFAFHLEEEKTGDYYGDLLYVMKDYRKSNAGRYLVTELIRKIHSEGNRFFGISAFSHQGANMLKRTFNPAVYHGDPQSVLPGNFKLDMSKVDFANIKTPKVYAVESLTGEKSVIPGQKILHEFYDRLHSFLFDNAKSSVQLRSDYIASREVRKARQISTDTKAPRNIYLLVDDRFLDSENTVLRNELAIVEKSCELYNITAVKKLSDVLNGKFKFAEEDMLLYAGVESGDYSSLPFTAYSQVYLGTDEIKQAIYLSNFHIILNALIARKGEIPLEDADGVIGIFGNLDEFVSSPENAQILDKITEVVKSAAFRTAA